MDGYLKVFSNRGSGGVDRISLEEFDKDFKNYLYKLWNKMSSGSYMPSPVRLVEIPKKDSGIRLLGVPKRWFIDQLVACCKYKGDEINE